MNHIEYFLESKHTIVGTAHDGMEAIAMTKLFTPDVVIMDLNMPKVNGIEATKHVKDI